MGTCSLVEQGEDQLLQCIRYSATGDDEDKFGGCQRRLVSFATCLRQGA